MKGRWNLQVSTPFGNHPATLIFERAGGALSGHIQSQLGDVPLTDINDRGDSFDADVSLTLQGRTYSARIDGRAEGDQLTGTINVKLPFAPTVRFTGTRA